MAMTAGKRSDDGTPLHREGGARLRLRQLVVLSMVGIFALYATYLALVFTEAIDRQLASARAALDRMHALSTRLQRYAIQVSDVAAHWPDGETAPSVSPHGPRAEVGATPYTHRFVMLTRDSAPVPPAWVGLAWRVARFEAIEWPAQGALITTVVVTNDGSRAVLLPAANGVGPPADLDALVALVKQLQVALGESAFSELSVIANRRLAHPLPTTQPIAYVARRFSIEGPNGTELATTIAAVGSSMMQLADISASQLRRFSVYLDDETPVFEGTELAGLRPIITRDALVDRDFLSDYRFGKGMLLLSIRSHSELVLYGVPVVEAFRADLWRVTVASVIVAIALTIIAIGYRRFRAEVLLPAASQLLRLKESEALTAGVLAAAPSGIFVLRLSDRSVVIANRLAEELLQRPLPDRNGMLLREALAHQLPPDGHTAEMACTDRAGEIRYVLVAANATRYQGEPAMLCSLADITERKRAESLVYASAEQAQQARASADAANAAKSLFLSTMSHEIRTPLHGMLGTLELMERDGLPESQRRRLDVAQNSARALLEVINSVLDFSRIEAGEFQLENTVFNPVDLIESTITSYAPLAHKKGLALQCCLQPAPEFQLVGDPARLRQIAANLISNAIKFTHVGRVVVRLDIEATADEANALPSTHLSLQVADSGEGIADADQLRLFEPFVQVEGASKGGVQGTGLGLPISRRLAQLMGGDIDLASTPGLGSCFFLDMDLPVRVSAQPELSLDGACVVIRAAATDVRDNLHTLAQSRGAIVIAEGDPWPPGVAQDDSILLISDDDVPMPGDEKYAAVVQLDSAPQSEVSRDKFFGADPYSRASIVRAMRVALGRAGRADSARTRHELTPLGLHVALVEDNTISRDLLVEQLARMGCQASPFRDAEGLLQWIERIAPDVIITDINLPGMDGDQLVSALRARGVSTPVIGMSANALTGQIETSLASGMQAYLVKPVLLDALYANLRSFSHDVPNDKSVRVRHADGMVGVVLGDESNRARMVTALQIDGEQLRRAIVHGDSAALEAIVHHVKGGFLSLAQEEGVELCLRIETALAGGEIETARHAALELGDYIENIIEAWK